MSVNGEQRKIFYRLITHISKEIDTKIHIESFPQENYKDLVLKEKVKEDRIDVFFGFAGNKLNTLLQGNFVEPITDIWNQNQFDEIFNSSKSAVTVNNEQYGLPIQYYQWGFYYSKKIFEANKITPPKTWAELLQICDILKKTGIKPFTLANKDFWPLMGWFDYAALRTMGLVKYNQLMKGEISWKSREVKEALQVIVDLNQKGHFVGDHRKLPYGNAYPYLIWNKAAMMLMGNFWLSGTKFNSNNIGFFPFPQMNNDENYEIAPLDIFFINRNSKNKEIAKKFLVAFSNNNILQKLNESVNTISPNSKSPPSNDYFLKEGASLLNKADGISLYFDRQIETTEIKKVMELISNYIFQEQNDIFLEAIDALMNKE